MKKQNDATTEAIRKAAEAMKECIDAINQAKATQEKIKVLFDKLSDYERKEVR